MPPITSILDDFNRANGAVGGNFSLIFGGLNVSNNQLAASGAGGIGLWNVSSFGPDSEVYASFPAIATTNNDLIGLYTRATGTTIGNFNGYNAVKQTNTAGNDQYRISRITNGSETVLASTTSIGDAQAGDRLWFTSIGNTHTLYRYRGGVWTEILSANDSTYQAAGRVGIGIVSTTARVDDFGGGTITAGSTVDLDGSTSLLFTGNATLAVEKPLTGTTGLSFNTAAPLQVLKRLAGSSGLTFTTEADLLVSKLLEGNTTLTFGANGDLTVVGGLAGATTLSFSGVGNLSVSKYLQGNTNITVGTIADLHVDKHLDGSTTLTFTALGTIGSDNPQILDIEVTVTQYGQVSAVVVTRSEVAPTVTKHKQITVEVTRWLN